MGLSVTAYSHLELLPAGLPANTYGSDLIHTYAYAGFEASTRGLANHDVLTVDNNGNGWIAEADYCRSDDTDTYSFSTSYSGHGTFRRELAAMVGHSVEDYWEGRVGSEAPFFELINFADNEGCLGSEAAADLLADFQQYREQFAALHENPVGEWTINRYDDWAIAFTLAAAGGAVQFG